MRKCNFDLNTTSSNLDVNFRDFYFPKEDGGLPKLLHIVLYFSIFFDVMVRLTHRATERARRASDFSVAPLRQNK